MEAMARAQEVRFSARPQAAVVVPSCTLWRNASRATTWCAVLVMSLAGCNDGSPTGTEPTLPCPANPNDVMSLDRSPTWSPDSRTIAYRHGGGSIGVYLVDIIVAQPVRLMDGDRFEPTDLSWSPDGSRIAMLFEGEIQTIDVQGHTLRRWTSLSDQFPAWPTWSPDSRYIAFALLTRPIRGTALRILDTQDGSIRDPAHLLENELTPASPASWSPDGTTLVFSRARGQIVADRSASIIYELFSLRLANAEFHQLTNLGGSANNPQWSRYGQGIFFDFAPEACDPGYSLNRATWVMEPVGSTPRRWPVNFGNPRVQLSYPFALSPDGEHVAFVDADATGRFGVIHMMRFDGTGRTQLTFPPDSLLGHDKEVVVPW